MTGFIEGKCKCQNTHDGLCHHAACSGQDNQLGLAASDATCLGRTIAHERLILAEARIVSARGRGSLSNSREEGVVLQRGHASCRHCSKTAACPRLKISLTPGAQASLAALKIRGARPRNVLPWTSQHLGNYRSPGHTRIGHGPG